MSSLRKPLFISVAMCILFALSFVLCLVFPNGILSGGGIYNIIALLLEFIILIWGTTMIYRTQYNKQKYILFAMILLCLLWIILRFMKWLIYIAEIQIYMEYLYYIPMNTIPALFLVLAIETFYPKFKGKYTLYIILISIITILIVFALTNDFHNLIYKNIKFVPVAPNSSILTVRYSYNYAHYVSMAYIGSTAIAAISILFIGTSKQISIKQIIFPVFVLLLGIVYGVIYALKIDFVRDTVILRDFALMFVIFIHAMLEAMLDSGILQNDGRYIQKFRKSSLPMCIYNENNIPIYRSESFNKASYINNNPEKKYIRKDIGKYYVVVEEDLSELLELRKKLTNETKELEETNALLSNMIDIYSQQASLTYKLEITNEIEQSIGKTKEEMLSILSTIPDKITEKNNVECKQKLGTIAFLLGYMKQKCMLLLNAKEQKNITEEAFSLLLDVISHDVQSIGFVNVGFTILSKGDVPFDFALAINDLIYNISRAYAFKNVTMFLILDASKGTCVANLEGDDLNISKELSSKPNTTIKEQDGAIRIEMEVKHD